MKTVLLGLFSLVLAAGPAFSQEIDLIGDLLSAPSSPVVEVPIPVPAPAPEVTPEPAASTDPAPVPGPSESPVPEPSPPVEKPADLAAEPVDPPPAATIPAPAAEPKPLTPVAPSPEPKPDRRSETPVHIDELGRTHDAPPTASDLNYEGRLRATFNAAQGMQGALDGRWVLRVNGFDAYLLQLVDKGQGVLEGAWRDTRRAGAVDSSGFIDEIQNVAGRLTIRFKTRRSGAQTVEATLEASAPGQWFGEVTDHGVRRSATLTRN
jgi:hypothetical protein